MMTARKRMPLIRPLCPVHGVPMVVYRVKTRLRYHRCVIDGCECRRKSERK